MSIKYYHRAATALRLPCTDIDYSGSLSINMPNKKYFFFKSITPFNDSASAALSNSVCCVYKLLKHAGIPPINVWLHAKASYPKLPEPSEGCFPLTVRPNREVPGEDHGLGGVIDVPELHALIDNYFSTPQDLALVADHPAFKSYRILVFNQSILGGYECTPACVQGNGVDTIKTLIDRKNTERAALGQQYGLSLGPIQYDDECKRQLKAQQLHLEDVPANKAIITLSYTCHPMRGGDCIPLKHPIAPVNKEKLLAAVKLFNLKLAEVVMLCQDISVPVQAPGGIAAIMHHPEIGLHQYSTPSGVQDIATHILKHSLLHQPYLRWRKQIC